MKFPKDDFEIKNRLTIKFGRNGRSETFEQIGSTLPYFWYFIEDAEIRTVDDDAELLLEEPISVTFDSHGESGHKKITFLEIFGARFSLFFSNNFKN